jgi:hypothetical protein
VHTLEHLGWVLRQDDQTVDIHPGFFGEISRFQSWNQLGLECSALLLELALATGLACKISILHQQRVVTIAIQGRDRLPKEWDQEPGGTFIDVRSSTHVCLLAPWPDQDIKAQFSRWGLSADLRQQTWVTIQHVRQLGWISRLGLGGYDSLAALTGLGQDQGPVALTLFGMPGSITAPDQLAATTLRILAGHGMAADLTAWPSASSPPPAAGSGNRPPG